MPKPHKNVSEFAGNSRQEMERLINKQRAVFQRWPLVFTLLGTFGFVATLYGFENLIDSIPLFEENPLILLATGIVILAFTGTLYKKLGE